MTFSEFGQRCVADLQFRKYSQNTRDAYERTYGQFVEYLHSVGLTDDLRQFTGDNVRAYAVDLDRRGAKASSIVRYLSALSTLATFGKRTPDPKRPSRMLLTDDPTETFEWPQVQEPETKYLRDAELRAFLSVPVEPYQDLARNLLVETGLRVSELCRASVGDLDVIAGEPVLAVIVKGRRSRERKINVPLSPELYRQIQNALWSAKREAPAAPILVTAGGQRHTRSSFASMMVRIGKRAGITRFDTTPHAFRHTANVIAKLAKIDPDTRSHLLNHADPRSQKRYDHIVRGELHAARDAWTESLKRYIGVECRATSTEPTEHPSAGGDERE